MKTIHFLLLVFFAGCSQKQSAREGKIISTPPETFFLRTDTTLRNNNGTWFYGTKKANGYILEKKEGALITRLPVIDGKANGLAYGWFESGEKRYEKSYRDGNRIGTHKIWYRNGQLAGVNYYVADKLEGEQKTYFESGNRWQSLRYVNGYEEGKQKTWNDSGRVINNFTVKNGKLYGIIGRYDCTSIMSAKK